MNLEQTRAKLAAACTPEIIAHYERLCDTCGVGHFLPSGVCDHCNTMKPGLKSCPACGYGLATGWRSVSDSMPDDGQFVIAHYKGVYGYRFVTFWKDARGTPHFGTIDSKDGQGIQPATHWMPLPPMP